MSNEALNKTGFEETIVRLSRRIAQIASVDPQDVVNGLLNDEEFRRKVFEALATSQIPNATNERFGIVKGQDNTIPEAWHLVTADDGLLSINRQLLEAWVTLQIKKAVDAIDISSGGGGGTNCNCPPPPLIGWQAMNGELKAEVERDMHMFAPFSFPKVMPKTIELFDKLTFIPNTCTGNHVVAPHRTSLELKRT